MLRSVFGKYPENTRELQGTYQETTRMPRNKRRRQQENTRSTWQILRKCAETAREILRTYQEILGNYIGNILRKYQETTREIQGTHSENVNNTFENYQGTTRRKETLGAHQEIDRNILGKCKDKYQDNIRKIQRTYQGNTRETRRNSKENVSSTLGPYQENTGGYEEHNRKIFGTYLENIRNMQ